MLRSRKHVIDLLLIGNDISGVVSYQLALGTLNPDYFTNRDNVRAECRIASMTYQFDVEIQTQAAVATQTIDWYIGFNINNLQAMPAPGAIGLSHIKNQIFHEEGALLSSPTTALSSTQFAHATWRGVLHIPRQWQQVNDGDTIKLFVKSNSATTTFNGKLKVIYTELNT